MNQIRLTGFALVLGAGFAVGCGEDASPPLVDCSTVTPKGYSALSSLWPLCTSCHSSALSGMARNMAPMGTNFDTYAAAMSKAAAAASRVNLGQMPPAGATQPSAQQKADLLAWATCGTPP